MARFRYPTESNGTTKDANGRVLDNVTISVFLTGTTTPAKIYAASSGGTAVYSIVSDDYGSFVFYVDTADYTYPQAFDIVYSKTVNNVVYNTTTTSDVQILWVSAVVQPQGTSVTPTLIQVASLTFVTQAGLSFSSGQYVIIASQANTANFMYGVITSYSGTSMTVTVSVTGGSGTYSDWKILLSGPAGSAVNYVTDVTGTAPIQSSSGHTPAISIIPATTSVAGSMSAADKLKLDNMGSGGLVPANNLSDVVSKATSRLNLEVGINWANPEQAAYGAVGDGSTLDTTAVQACLNSGCTWIGLTKNYKVGLLTIPSTVRHITGSGTLTQAAAGANILAGTSLINLDIDHLRFVGVGGDHSESSNTGIYLTTPYNIHVTKCYFTGMRYGPFVANGGSSVWVNDNEVYSCSHGIFLNNVSGGSMDRNILSYGQYSGLADPLSFGGSSDLSICNNTVKSWPWVQAIQGHGGTKVTIANNNLDNVAIGVLVNAFAPGDSINRITVTGNNIDLLSSAGAVTDVSVGILVSSYGISNRGMGVNITGNNITYGNITTLDGGLGTIEVGFMDGVVVNGNYLYHPYGNGILIQGCNDGSVVGNVITNIGAAGGQQNAIRLYNSFAQNNIQIKNNLFNQVVNGVLFDSSTYSGIVARINDITNYTNAFSGESQSGIAVAP